MSIWIQCKECPRGLQKWLSGDELFDHIFVCMTRPIPDPMCPCSADLPNGI